MTYKSEVLADAPYIYLTYDDSANVNANFGSYAGVTVTNFGSTSAGGYLVTGSAIGDYQAWNIGSNALLTSNTNWTLETWFRRSDISGGINEIFYRSGSGYLNTYINASNQLIHETSTAAGAKRTITGPAITDTNWHHLAIIHSATNAGTYMVLDGVVLSNSSVPTSTPSFTTEPILVGRRFGGNIDEPAIYSKAVSAARLKDHFDQGRPPGGPVSVSVAAPVATISLTTPAPVVRAVKNTRSVVTGTPLITLTAPNARNLQTKSVATVATLSLTTGNVTVRTTDASQARYVADYDRDSDTGTTAQSLQLSSANGEGYIHFPSIVVGTGNYLVSAKLKLATTFDNSASGLIRIHRLTSAFSELVEPGFTTDPTKSTQYVEFNIPSGLSGGTYFEIDVTSLLNEWTKGGTQYGIAVVNKSGSTIYIRSSEAIGGNPEINTVIAATPQVPVTVSVPPAVISLTTPTPQVRGGVKTKVTGAASVTLSALPTTLRTTRSVRVVATAANLFLTAPNARAANPEYIAKATAAVITLSAPAATAIGGHDHKVSVPAATMTLSGTEGHKVTFATNRVVRVINAAQITLRVPGVYNRASDRYLNFVPGTVNAAHMWFQMEETAGTVANDSALTPPVFTFGGNQEAAKGAYVGGPVFGAEGPELRKAVHFDGVDDRFVITSNYDPYYTQADATIEFSFRTTQLNGTVFSSGGSGQQTSTVAQVPIGNHMLIVDGYLTLQNEQGSRFKVRKFVADGQWHHIVFSMSESPNFLTDRRTFVMIDGVVEFSRFQAELRGARYLPHSFMARALPTANGYAYSDYLAGDLRDVIIRPSYALSTDTATKLYYEWSNTLLVKAGPATINLRAQAPKVSGNAKKMLLLYGLGNEGNASNSFRGAYDSLFARIPFKVEDGTVTGGTPLAVNGNHVPKPFFMENYLVYPVSITGQQLRSAPGTVNHEYSDTEIGGYIDDKTGLYRFIDLDLDLVGDVTQYDVISVMNYPAPRPETSINPNGNDMYQYNITYAGIDEWTIARDKLRDTILNAYYRGVDLWIPEIHMAEHLELIDGWDIHDLGRFGLAEYAPTTASDKLQANRRGYELDLAHGGVNSSWIYATTGDYVGVYQANAYRRLVATEPGLTDLPGYIIGDYIDRNMFDRFNGYADVQAYDVIDRTGGLQVGDLLWYSPRAEVSGSSLRNAQLITSARPEGIVGKVLSREMERYYGPNGVVIENPYKNNAVTIVAERGTVVRGRAGGGRIFMDFMDDNFYIGQGTIVKDNPEKYVIGPNGWDFDTRRYGPYSVGDQDSALPLDGGYINLPFLSLHTRGLRWLAAKADIPEGDVRVYAAAAEITLRAPAPKATYGRNITVRTQAARIYLEAVQPANVDSPDAEVRAQAVEITLTFGGLARTIKAGPAEITLTAPDARSETTGDRVYVYLNNTRNVTVYLKEE